MKLENIDFVIKNIDVKYYNNDKIRSANFNFDYHNHQPIRITTETSTSNLPIISNWFFQFKSHKYFNEITINTVQLKGIKPTSYTIKNKHTMKVTFDIDYIYGDINLLDTQELRREKLKKIHENKGN